MVERSILVIGESDVGKTHYGAQMLKRLMRGNGAVRMNGAATNLEPFEAALASLDQGRAADHTAATNFVDSVWPVADKYGNTADLVWPDYRGEQVREIVTTRRLPSAWRARVIESPVWMFMVRLQRIRVSDDIFSKPLSSLRGRASDNREVILSDQARLIELLQILLNARAADLFHKLGLPKLAVLLTCWDELNGEAIPAQALQKYLPMFSAFVQSNWAEPLILGVSALEKPLDPHAQDEDYIARGPEQFGYVVLGDGRRSHDLTEPAAELLVA